MSFIVALLGAESTGKTTLARELVAVLQAEGRSVALVPEYLREFCDRHGRTPQQDEQVGIAAEQARRIAAAAATHDIVVADTSALMIAVYSDHVFGDTGLYDQAERVQHDIDLTLVTALDLPWQADGLQRDGPHVRVPIDEKVRASLARSGVGYSVVSGTGNARCEAAMSAIRHAMKAASDDDNSPRWQWHCDRCGDADCERHLLPRR
jgi:nicotinamide riboside kinase